MANTVTQQTLFGDANSKKVVRHIHIVSDGTEESDLVVYDNSAFIANTAKGKVEKIVAQGSSCVCRLEWDQTTDSPVASFDPAAGVKLKFCDFGGIKNPAGTGATGDLVLTTAGLDAGDEVSIYITIDQS